MSLWISFEQSSKEVDHLLSQIPAVERTAVNNRKLISQSQLVATTLAINVAKLEQRKIRATRDHFVMHRAATQSLPFFDDGPDTLGHCHDAIRCRENAALGRLGQTIWQTTFAPVFRVNILLGHQPSQVEDHLRAETSLKCHSNGSGNMSARVDHLNPVAPYQAARFANPGKHVVDRCRH